MKPAKDLLAGLYIARPDGLYIRHTKWQSRREEASFHAFQMGTVTPNGQCDASAKPNRSVAHCRDLNGWNAPEMQQGAVLHHNRSEPSRQKRKITSVSVSPLIPFNPFELMSSFTAHQPPHPTTLTYRRGYENSSKGQGGSHHRGDPNRQKCRKWHWGT